VAAAFGLRSGELTLWSNTQIPHAMRDVIARTLSLPVCQDVLGSTARAAHPTSRRWEGGSTHTGPEFSDFTALEQLGLIRKA